MRGNKEKGEGRNLSIKALVIGIKKYIAAWSICINLKKSFTTRREDIVLQPKSGDLSTKASQKIISDAIKGARHDRMPLDPDTFVRFWKILESADLAHP